MYKTVSLTLTGLFAFFIACSNEVKIVNAKDFIQGRDATPGIYEAIRFCRSSGAKKLIIPTGEYEFWPDYATEKFVFISNNDGSMKRIAFDCSRMKNFEIDGQGSRFIFHGFITPFLLDNTENITIKNFSIDYARTFHSEAKILSVTDESIDVNFSPEYPYKIDNSVLLFTDDEKREYPWSSLLEFDPQKRETAYNVVDYWCGPNTRVKELSPGNIRLFYPGIKATVGNVLVFGASHRLAPAFIVKNSKRLNFSHLTLYHCGGMGIVAQLSEDINVEHVKVTPAQGRTVSITADATHFVNCRGKIRLADCLFENQKDDATNIHGLYAKIEAIQSPSEVIARMVHPQQAGIDFIFPGTTIEFVDSESLNTLGTGVAADVSTINKEYSKIRFTQPLSEKIKLGDGIADLYAQPEVLIQNCLIRGNRARGILLGSRAKTVIENNVFHTPGAAILLEGDCRFWYEQAGVRDLVVRNNTFDNCFYGTWGNAVIQVGSGIRDDKKSISRYNRNIVIENNLFKMFTPEMLNVYSVEGLVFKNNTIEPTDDYPPKDKNAKRFIVEQSSKIEINE